MKRYIVRSGKIRGEGNYLEGFTRNYLASVTDPMWGEDQRLMAIYTSLREAHKAADAAGGRVVRLT